MNPLSSADRKHKQFAMTTLQKAFRGNITTMFVIQADASIGNLRHVSIEQYNGDGTLAQSLI